MPPSLSQLIDDLHNEQNFSTRLNAISKLSWYTESDTLDLLLTALKDPYYRVREKAAQLLVRVYDPRVTDPLIAAVTDIPAVRDAALEALRARILPDEVQGRISSYMDSYSFYKRRKELQSDSRFTNNGSLEYLLKAAKDPDFLVREAAVKALSTIPEEEAFIAITEACDDLYLSVREAALRSLHSYKGPLPAPLIAETLTTTYWPLFDAVVNLLLDQEYEHTVDVLLDVLQHDNFVIRRRARDGLSRVAERSTLSTLIHSLNEWDSTDQAIPAYTIPQFFKEGLNEHVNHFSTAMLGLMGSIVERDWPKGIEALHRLADKDEFRHLAFFCTAELDRRNHFDVSGVLDRTYDLQKKYDAQYLCTQHLARFHLCHHDGNKYLGCRICKQTHTSTRAPKLIAVLDNAESLQTHEAEGSYRVNWLKHRMRMDFDAVEIGECPEDAITEFCIDMGNDTDAYRIQKYKSVLCIIQRDVELSAESMNLLKNRFKKLEVE